MSNKLIRKGWYDGWFYAWFIDSNFTQFRNRIFKYIEPDKRIIDIGCGTGRFTQKIAERSKYVLGVDISEKQINMAQKRLKRTGVTNVDFLHASATDLKNNIADKFDYAILTFILHEIQQPERVRILSNIKEFAEKILILDYHHPMAQNISGHIIRLTEFFAGREHFENFRDFNKRGGLTPLLQESGLKIIQDKINRPQVFRTVVSENSA
jgi:SAM-dependent methyltransferase